MKVVIQVAADDDARAWDLLQRHSSGVALPMRTVVVSEQAVHALHEAGVRFHEVSREAAAFRAEGATVGERI